jgi:hypothetical protein
MSHVPGAFDVPHTQGEGRDEQEWSVAVEFAGEGDLGVDRMADASRLSRTTSPLAAPIPAHTGFGLL